MTYPHIMLQDVKANRHPTTIRPILVHQKVDFAAFNYFASSLIGLNKDLKQVLVFRTDGDKALIEALSHDFPFATNSIASFTSNKMLKRSFESLAFLLTYCKSLSQISLGNE